MNKDKERSVLTVSFQVTPSQALALEAFFEMWNDLASMGCSRDVSFFVDGDGNFKPSCTIAHSEEIKELGLPDDVRAYLVDKAWTSKFSKTENDARYFDYDNIAWALHYYRNKSFCLSEKEIRLSVKDDTLKLKEGYYKGMYARGVCRFETLQYTSKGRDLNNLYFNAPYAFRDDEGNEIEEYPIWCRSVIDGDSSWITIHQQFLDISEGGFRCFDREMERYIPEEKFI